MRRRRRNPESTQPILTEEDVAEIRSRLEYGQLDTEQSVYARWKILQPVIDDLKAKLADLEGDLTSEMLSSDSFDPLRSDLSPYEAKLEAENSLVSIMLIMLVRLDRLLRSRTETLHSRHNPRRRRLKRYY